MLKIITRFTKTWFLDQIGKPRTRACNFLHKQNLHYQIIQYCHVEKEPTAVGFKKLILVLFLDLNQALITRNLQYTDTSFNYEG